MALLFFDIDGTLITLDEQHIMPESTKEALKKAKENGHKIFINTGRVKTAIDKHLLNFGFDGLVCGCGTYIEYEGKELLHKSFSKEQCRKYAKLLKDYGYQTVFEGKDRIFMEGEHGPGSFLEFIYNYFSKNSDYPIESPEHEAFIFDKFTTVQQENCNRTAFEQTFGEEFTMIPHTKEVLEMVPKGYSKASGIRFLEEYLKEAHEECYAFGDSVNDMEMLKYVPHSIAMGNSMQPVFEVAEYTTKVITEGGIWNALSHYGLI
ncbi:MAG: HAD family hydrolase [Clostridiales bacterium]|nr:HAD family hydrolase [Clostridiales bacterium]